jgi:hypothetical protein
VVVVTATDVVVFTVVAGGGTYETVGLVSGVCSGGSVVGAGVVAAVVVETAGPLVVVVGASARALDPNARAGNATTTTVAAMREPARLNPICKGSAGGAAP